MCDLWSPDASLGLLYVNPERVYLRPYHLVYLVVPFNVSNGVLSVSVVFCSWLTWTSGHSLKKGTCDVVYDMTSRERSGFYLGFSP